ncbi:YihY family inner membrane protein [Caldichromatium japonicum]|uniref:YihY family inner membrane protein n=2 Tax=Caldichromatium japonicum TaxID=2699430 RepID=A0A6G7VG70_9GAMM|nr:YihY family inner membrane protein [Caldichromatium japonicum]
MPAIHAKIKERLWGADPAQLAPTLRWALYLGRLVYALARDLSDSQLGLYAMSLVYTTLLSLVPLLAVSFSVLKGFGVHSQLEPLLANALAPLGESGAEITRQLVGFVDRMQVGVLGALGLGMLFYTVLSLIQKIEQAFNYVWRVDQERALAQRVIEYLSVLTIGPVLFFSAIGVSASLGGNPLIRSFMDSEAIDWMLRATGILAPYLMISATFAFVYRFVPNTEVRLQSALLGGVVAGLLWETIGGLFGQFMAGSTQYTAIYSSLAILILFMLWVYIGWLILLFGSSLAFYHQHPELLETPEREPSLSPREREWLALRLAAWIARAYLDGAPPPHCEALARLIRQSAQAIRPTMDLLEQGGYVVRTAASPAGYVLRRPPEAISILEIVEQARRCGEGQWGNRRLDPPISDLMACIDTALASCLEGMTLRMLAERLAENRSGQIADQDDSQHDRA